MSINERIEKEVEKQMLNKQEIKEAPKPVKVKKPFEFKIKIPSGVMRKARKKNVFAVLFLGGDKELTFTNGYYNDGLLKVDGRSYSFEAASVFTAKKGKVPVVVLYDWRITPIGGFTESCKEFEGSSFLEIKEDHKFAEEKGLTNYGQQTIIRDLQQAQQDDKKKGMGGVSGIMWLIGGVVVVYLLSQFFGGA